MSARFEVITSAPGPGARHAWWRLVGANSEPLATSETYTRHEDAVRGLRDALDVITSLLTPDSPYPDIDMALDDALRRLTYADVKWSKSGKEKRVEKPLFGSES